LINPADERIENDVDVASKSWQLIANDPSAHKGDWIKGE
jgi:hypothetical protein